MEPRERPDGFRIQSPPFKDNRHGYNRSGCFAFFNDSKYSVTGDLKKPAGVALARRMAQWCDLVVENMRAGVMERLGLGFAALAELNPRLVMLSTCNMGQTGPRADQPGFGSQLSALAGVCELTGVPDGPPMLLYGPYIDYIASLLGTSAALAGVIRSRRTGRGALIDLSQYECGLVFMGAALQDFFASGRGRAQGEMGDHAYCYRGFDLAGPPGDIVGPAPCVGADNDFVSRDLTGLTQAEYAAYRQQGVFD